MEETRVRLYREALSRYTPAKALEIVTGLVFPQFDCGYDAFVAGLQPNTVFVTDLGRVRSMAEEPGVYRTRGEYGDTVYSYQLMIPIEYEAGDRELTCEDIVRAGGLSELMGRASYKVWDSDFGWL